MGRHLPQEGSKLSPDDAILLRRELQQNAAEMVRRTIAHVSSF
jgi:hypothetical protein